MRVLVTGGSGFVGAALCPALLRQGYTVRATYRTKPAGVSGVEWVRTGNLIEANYAELLHDCDFVVHLAALAHQVHEQVAPGEFDRINHQATAVLARAVANARQVKRLIFVSSIGALCSSASSVVTHDTVPAPDSEYGRSKRYAEIAVQGILAGTTQDWCILRPTLVYGPGNPGNMLRLMRLAASPIPIPFGSIQNRRSFLYVENLGALIETVLQHPGASRQVFNISDSEVLSTPELIRQLAILSGKRARLVSAPAWSLRFMGKAGDLLARVRGKSFGVDSYSIDRLLGSLEVDNSYVRTKLNWDPPYTTQEGLRRTLAHPARVGTAQTPAEGAI